MSMKHRRSAKIMAVTATAVALAGLGLWLLPQDADGQESSTIGNCYVIIGQGGCPSKNCCTASTTPETWCDFSESHSSAGVMNLVAKNSGGGILGQGSLVVWCRIQDCGPHTFCGQGACGLVGEVSENKQFQVLVGADCEMAE